MRGILTFVLSLARVHLGIAYLAKGHETSAHQRFHEALEQHLHEVST